MPQSKPDPWDWLNPHDIERFGPELLDPPVRRKWCGAILTGGLPLMWRRSAAPVRDMMMDRLALTPGDRVLLIGESNESCGFLDEIGKRIGTEGTLESIDVIEQGRTRSMARERGRGGQIGTWQYDYTFATPADTYDAVAVFQGVQQGERRHHRSSPQSAPMATIVSASNATSSTARPTRSDAPPRWRRGRSSRARRPHSTPEIHRCETGSHWTDSYAAEFHTDGRSLKSASLAVSIATAETVVGERVLCGE